MKILFAASEAAPFIKTGGLGDVAGSLPAALAEAGHEVKVIVPLYEGIPAQWRDKMRFERCFYFDLAWRNVYCGVFSLEKDGVTYWFVDNEYYFKRHEIYGHYDDGERFAYFSKAIIEVPYQMDWSPDILHANDWQTALAPIYLLEARYHMPQLAHTKSVFTIHNIEYQGRYGAHMIEDVFGLSMDYFNEHMLEYYGDVNLMKGAIYAADAVTTVSETYAQEIQYSFYAHGLEEIIWDNREKLTGIVNGLDVKLYDPATDMGLARKFSVKDMAGKRACKTALQRAVGLREDPDIPIVACVSRLVRHKGFDLVIASLNEIMNMDVQMVILGTGEWNYEEALRNAAAQYPARFSACIRYSTTLSTVIYGGADLYLMPSVAEPCGLSQMIAMRYGTIPIVRETGGLRDTVPPYQPETGEGRGFTFASIDPQDMMDALHRAVDVYHNAPDAWKKLQKAGMEADFSWNSPAEKYQKIYRGLSGEEAL